MSKVVHFEIAANDPERLSEFYVKVFGWEIREWKQPGVKKENRHWLIRAGEKDEIGSDGGMYKRKEEICEGGPNSFVCNIAVDDIEKAIQLIKENGGKSEQVMKIAGVGKSAACKDPEGNMFSVFSSDPDSIMRDM